ncbi:MAG: hypothetical protein OXT74_04260 [Candidatus Poribacteria bacterium]|nr:hypothetical protein [Candidatus Poribacteria bacterium]
MSWILMGQIAALIALYVGGIFSVAHTVGNRVGDLSKNMSNRFEQVDQRFNDLLSQMSREHDDLARKVDAVDRKLDAHISNYEIHKSTESD